MLPRFTRRGLLPPGIHCTTLAEVLGRFGKGSGQRVAVTERLQRILALAGRGGWLRRVFLFGSYVTGKAEPNDVDVLFVMADDFLVEHCDPEARRLFDPDVSGDELGATLLWVRQDIPHEVLDALLDWWQSGREGTPRGIVEVTL